MGLTEQRAAAQQRAAAALRSDAAGGEPTVDESKASASAAAPAPQRVVRPTLGPAPGAIDPADPFAVAGRKAMWPHVGRMLEREDALRDPSQTDALKRYRVATRRLRAAFRVFRDAYPRRASRPLLTGLRDLAGALGRVRDLDVRLEEIEDWAKRGGDEAARGIAPLRAALAQDRRTGAAALERKLDARGHEKLMTALAAFVTAGDDAERSADGGPERMTGNRAASAIWTAYEEVRAFASVVRRADLTTLHDLRIRAKRLRYTIEFLGAALGPERELLVARLIALQDHLGALNDASLASAAVRAFLAERHATLEPEQRAATIAYLADRERERNRLRRSVGRAWRPVVSATFARRLGRTVVVRPVA